MNKTQRIINQQWIETPPQPAARLTAVTLRRVTRLEVKQLNTQAEKLAIVDGACIALSAMLKTPIATLDPLLRCGRVVLVEYVPHGAYDPIQPVPMVNQSWFHDVAYRLFAALLEDWNRRHVGYFSASFLYNRLWHGQMGRLIKILLMQAAKSDLTAAELRFYGRQLATCISNPDRRDLLP